MAEQQLAINNTSSHTTFVTAHDAEQTVVSLRIASASLVGAVDCLVFCHSPEGSSSHPEFRKLRSRLTACAFIYRDLHLPLSTQLVKNLSNLMSLYEAMDVPTFCEHIQVVAEDVKQTADYASKVVAIHVRLLEDLNKLHNDAQATLATLELEATRSEKQAMAYSEEGKNAFKKEKRDGIVMGAAASLWALDAALNGGVPIIAGTFAAGASLYTAISGYKLTYKAKERLEAYNVLSIAAEKEAEMADKASQIVRDPLTSSVKSFVQAFEQVAGFLTKLEGDASNYARNASKVATNRNNIAIYLKVLKSQSAKVEEACAAYLNVMPAVEGRMGALSGVGCFEPNHVEKWLAQSFPNDGAFTVCRLVG